MNSWEHLINQITIIIKRIKITENCSPNFQSPNLNPNSEILSLNIKRIINRAGNKARMVSPVNQYKNSIKYGSNVFWKMSKKYSLKNLLEVKYELRAWINGIEIRIHTILLSKSDKLSTIFPSSSLNELNIKILFNLT